MKKLIIATGLLMATSAYAQTEVLTGVTRGKDYGVVYALPKTQQYKYSYHPLLPLHSPTEPAKMDN